MRVLKSKMLRWGVQEI